MFRRWRISYLLSMATNLMLGRLVLKQRSTRCSRSSFVALAFQAPSPHSLFPASSRRKTISSSGGTELAQQTFRERTHSSNAGAIRSLHAAAPAPPDDATTTAAASTETAAATAARGVAVRPTTGVVDATSPILAGLNPSQIEAVTQPMASVTRVVAGPGSGKTRVLTSRIAWLLQQNTRDRILGVTFTRKASGEMQERLHRLLAEQEQTTPTATTASRPEVVQETVGDATASTPVGLDRVTLGTFHSICAKILRWNGDHLASLPSVIDDMSKSPSAPVLDGNFNIADQGEQVRIVKECLAEYNIDLKPYDLKPLQVLNTVSQFKRMLSKGENPFAEPKDTTTYELRVVQITQKVYYRCREKLLSTNCIDFDDLIYLTRELLLVNDDLRSRLQNRWNHVLVDEYQDTSQTQMDLIKLLTDRSLFVVGDADQSIYSWRGAHVGSLSDFANDFRQYHTDGVSTVYLMENYRSTSNIVKAAQKVISASKSGESTGADQLRQNMIPKRSAGPSPRIVACDDGQSEATFVVKKVKELVSSGVYGPDYSVAFIYRTNAQSRHLEEACVQHNLPYVIFGSATSFYKRQEIKDCLCFFRWLYNGRDRSSMLRAIETPKRGLGDTAIREFDEYCALVDQHWEEHHPEASKATSLEILFHLSGDDSWCALKGAQFPPPSVAISTRPLKLLTEFSRQMVGIRNLAKTATVEQVLTAVVSELGLISHLDKISKSKSEFEERQANVEELQQATQRYADAGPCLPAVVDVMGEDGFTQSPLGNFLDDVALVTDMADSAERSTEQRFVAKMMTIHASKGMEFDTVFFVGIEDGTLPTSQALKEGEDSVVFEEEKRLCYVAMTRAKTELVMSWRKEVPIFTADGVRSVQKSRSRFLDVLVSTKEGTSSVQSIGKNTNTLDLAQKTKLASAKFSSRASPQTPQIIPSPKIAQKAKKLTSVHARQNKFPFVALAAEAPMKPRPSQPPEVENMRSSTTYRSAGTGAPGASRAMSSKSIPPPQPQPIDSTWFFPIGSKVRHQQLGEGVVLPPDPKGKGDEAAVRVEFRTGEQREFPVQTADLSPIVI